MPRCPVRRLASAFSAQLRADMSPDDMAEAIRRNAAETIRGCCHTHDFVDANECMAAAFASVLGREPCAQDPSDAGLWEAAWALASASGFLPYEPTE